ncbi:unnamed protein product, partial [Iphiclides podalirius]
MRLLCVVLLVHCTIFVHGAKTPKKYNITKPSAKYDNPNFIRDRFRDEIRKPFFNETWQNRFKRPFHPSWMDYCDPYHCNAYNRIACGLNRKKMHFKWFRSGCHIILNNMCSSYRGNLKYDMVDQKFCVRYVLFLRSGCPVTCAGEELEPVCGVSGVDNHVVLFRNRCALDSANCRRGILQEYEEVHMDVCGYYL